MNANADRWRRAEALFHEAITMPVTTRQDWLSAACAGDTELAALVTSLVASFEQAEAFTPPPPPPTTALRFGPYAVDRKLGEGGMGAVYLAHRDDGQFDQTVAIKVLRTQLTDDLFLARFRLERQILASLNHPNIARLLDGGITATGALYLVMEYVEGIDLDRYASTHALDTNARLRLFLQVTDAVAYAHQHLIIHRDLKPGNILVTPDGQVKLLDFGTAKLLTPAAESTDSEMTRAGFHAYTPDFASPEQILGQTVTTASDIYSLGVILYRLLTSRPPYQLTDRSTAELLRVVCHQEAASAQCNPDLDAILARMLRKEPAARYRSLNECIDDLQAYLTGNPVRARRGGWQYRAAKFIRRNRLAVTSAGLLLLSATAGVVSTLHEARRAQSHYLNLRALTNSLLGEMHDAIRDLPGSTPAQKLLVTRTLQHLDKLAAAAGSDHALQLDLAGAYLKMGNLQGNPYESNLGDMVGGLATLANAQRLTSQLIAAHPQDRNTIRIHALALRSIADIHFGSGRASDAIRHISQASTLLQSLANGPSASATDVTEAAATAETLGDYYGQTGVASLGDSAHALTQYQAALALHRRATQLDPSLIRPRRGIAIVLMKLGNIALDTNPDAARASYLDALQSFRQLPATDIAAPANRRILSVLLRKAGSRLRRTRTVAGSPQLLPRSRPH